MLDIINTSCDYPESAGSSDSGGLIHMWLSAYERAATLLSAVKRQGNLDSELEEEIEESLRSAQENNEGFVLLLQLEMELLSVLEE